MKFCWFLLPLCLGLGGWARKMSTNSPTLTPLFPALVSTRRTCLPFNVLHTFVSCSSNQLHSARTKSTRRLFYDFMTVWRRGIAHPCGNFPEMENFLIHLLIPGLRRSLTCVWLTWRLRRPPPPLPPRRGGSLGRSLMGRFASLVRSGEKEGKGGVRLGHDIQLSHIPQRKESRTLLIRRKENCLRWQAWDNLCIVLCDQ